MTTVMSFGVFDILHHGHLEHLRQAKAMGDKLIVVVIPDDYVQKGPGKPFHNQTQRKEILLSLKYVDEVLIASESTAMTNLAKLKPDIYVRGPDYLDPNHQFREAFLPEKTFVESYGGTVRFTEGPTMSSTAIFNKMKGYPINRNPWVVQAWLDKARAIKAVAAGESILDEYLYVRPAFKSPKEGVVTYLPDGANQKWHGGITVIGKHLEEACQVVEIISPISKIIKQRIVEKPFLNKVFKIDNVYALESISHINTQTDLLLIADFGHGAFLQGMDFGSRFLALTVQANSLNWGFNTFQKWPRANYLMLDEMEVRLGWQDERSAIEVLAEKTLEKMRSQILAVTRGHEGCLVTNGYETIQLPALADKVVDRMGSGDAFFAWTAPLAYLGAPLDIIAFVGNIAGGIEVGKLGNEVVTRKEMDAWITGLLK